MSINQFAYHILSSSQLEEKLTPINSFDDSDHFSAAIFKEPNRSKKIQFTKKKNRIKFPSIDALENETSRGILFHFFANHELLALELMAHILLRFQNAPKAYRKALAGIMLDEQRHLKLYLNEMKKVSLEFGDIAISDFFWRVISKVKSLQQFIAYLNLSFEQANLDFARYYMEVFSKLDSPNSVSILQIVYNDEIRHVQHGIEYFSKWKNPKDSVWKAYLKELEFPMSAQRAKGNIFYADIREKLGFDTEFTSNLELFSHSKGKTPDVYFFNPLAEYEVANTSVKKTFSCLQDDLEGLLFFLAKKDDIVLQEKSPSDSFLRQMKSIGISLPETVILKKLNSLRERKLNHFKPWANTVYAQNAVQELQNKFYQINKIIDSKFYTKSFASTQLNLFLQKFPNHFYSPKSTIGIPCAGFSKIIHAIDYFKEEGFSEIVVKANLASAGNQFYFVKSDTDLTRLSTWIEKQNQDNFLVEPWLNRQVDFSIHLERFQNGRIKYHGILHFHTSAHGRFKGTHLGSFNSGLNIKFTRFLHFKDNVESKGRLNNLVEDLLRFFEESKHFSNFIGPFSIDSLLYYDPMNNLKIKPIVEINPRYTMGRVSLSISKHIHPNCSGSWFILSKKQLQKQGFNSFKHFAKQKEKEHPLTIKDAKLFSGFLPTSDYLNAEEFISYLIV